MAWFDFLSPIAALQGTASGRINRERQAKQNQQRGSGVITPPGWTPQGMNNGMSGQPGSSLGGGMAALGGNGGGQGYGLAGGPPEDWWSGQPAHVLQTPLYGNEQ